MFLVPIFVLAGVALLAWLVAQWPAHGAGEPALEIARRRLASGEISDTQFREIQQTLGAPSSTAAPQRGFMLLLTLLAALVFLVMSVWMVAWTARGDDWGWGGMGGMMRGGGDVWGWGQMGRMMRWDRSPAGGTTLETDASEVAIQIRDFTYTPQTVSVKAGARVTWTNDDVVPHTATDRSAAWDTKPLSRGQSSTQAFSSVGTFHYYCTLHPSMTGSVIVRP